MEENKEQRLEQLAAIMGIVGSRLDRNIYANAKGNLKKSGLEQLVADISDELEEFANDKSGNRDLIYAFIDMMNIVDLGKRDAFEKLGKIFHNFTILLEDEKPIDEPKDETKATLPKPFNEGPGGGLH